MLLKILNEREIYMFPGVSELLHTRYSTRQERISTFSLEIRLIQSHNLQAEYLLN